MSDYAARVRAARAYAGLTQKQLAQRLGTTEQTVKRRESGAQEPRSGERIAIAAICGVPPEFMEHGFGDITPSEILARLERIEASLAGVDLEPTRDYVRAIISELRAGEGDGEAAAPTPPPGADLPQAETPRPRARSPKRS